MIHFPETFPVPLIHVHETDSTLNYLQTLCKQSVPKEFTTVVADFQTSGRGQRGNSWESESGKNLLFSFVLFPTFLEARRQFLISQIISLAIKEELDTYTSEISIKWPNDIYWKEKKICGMLIENDLVSKYINQSIAGIGININQELFLSTAPNPVSLFQITQQQHDIAQIASNIIVRIQEYYALLQKGETQSIAHRYKEALFRKKGMHLYRAGECEFKACIVDVEPDGRLVLEDEFWERKEYMFKEVEYILK